VPARIARDRRRGKASANAIVNTPPAHRGNRSTCSGKATPSMPSPDARRRISGQQRREPAVPQHAAVRRRLRLNGTSMTRLPVKR
jgi:hypothetical protein